MLKYDIHIWEIDHTFSRNSAYTKEINRLLDFLSEKERDRLYRYSTTDLQKKYIVSRAALKMILSSYHDIPEKEIEFGTNTYGKPYLLTLEHGMHFNLSHSGDKTMIALSNYQVGIDIEKKSRARDIFGIARDLSPVG